MGLTRMQKWFAIVSVCAVLTIGFFFAFVEKTTVQGNQVAVLETWGGVDDKVYGPKTYIRFPGFMYEFIRYDMSQQVYVMNDLPGSEEFAQGREKDSYLVQSKDSQDMQISLNVTWRLDPDKLVHLHKTVRKDFEEKVLRPALLLIVKDEATVMEAIVAYSGEGLVRLQSSIRAKLSDPNGIVRSKGIIVENFAIEGIKLDEDYIGQIKDRQVAIQRDLKAKQEEIAALSEAQVAKAVARADYEREVMAAERDKQVGILAAERGQQERILAAEADKQEQVLAAQGEQEAGVLKAEAIMAIGEAEAHAKKVQLQAYAVEGAEMFARIEIARSVAQGFQNIDGYLPEDMTINLLTNSFIESMAALMGGDAIDDKK